MKTGTTITLKDLPAWAFLADELDRLNLIDYCVAVTKDGDLAAIHSHAAGRVITPYWSATLWEEIVAKQTLLHVMGADIPGQG